MADMVLLGDEAVALGAVHAGLTAAYAYPGTPSTEILEYLLRHKAKNGRPHAAWATNEKTAYEAALGVSFAGRRALVSMKHVGLNVAADPFMNSALVSINGGLVVVGRRRPGMHSSQNEQDSRFYADFARDRLPRAGQPAGGLRHDARGVRPVGALPRSRCWSASSRGWRTAAPSSRVRRAAGREPVAQGAGAGVVDPAAGQRAAPVARPARRGSREILAWSEALPLQPPAR